MRLFILCFLVLTVCEVQGQSKLKDLKRKTKRVKKPSSSPKRQQRSQASTQKVKTPKRNQQQAVRKTNPPKKSKISRLKDNTQRIKKSPRTKRKTVSSATPWRKHRRYRNRYNLWNPYNPYNNRYYENSFHFSQPRYSDPFYDYDWYSTRIEVSNPREERVSVVQTSGYQGYDVYPFANGTYFKHGSGKTMMLNTTADIAYNASDEIVMTNIKFFLAIESLTFNYEDIELRETSNDPLTIKLNRLSVGYFYTFEQADASVNAYIGRGVLDLEDDDNYTGWNFGLDVKAFITDGWSMNINPSFYFLGDGDDFLKMDVYTLDINIAYHIKRFEIRAGLKTQSIKTYIGSDYESDEPAGTTKFDQKFIGIGFYL